MGFLKRLLSPPGSTPQVREVDAWLMAPSRPEAVVEVVGESNYQPALELAAAGRTEDGPVVRDHRAVLVPEPDNPYDENAIGVHVESRLVGYLSREEAIAYRPVVDWARKRDHFIACEAYLTGGWDRGGRDRGSIGVILHLGTPGECMIELIEDELTLRMDHEWAGQTIAFTGDSRCLVSGILLDRQASELLATRAGMVVHPRVTKHVQLLVDCDPRGVSGNQHKAMDYGIPVVAEREFWLALGLAVEETDWRHGR